MLRPRLALVCTLAFSMFGSGCDGLVTPGDSKVHPKKPSTPKVGSPCGGMSGANCGDPADGLFCDFPISAQCGSADRQGQCAQRPDGCADEYVPVCGCDDETHGNACYAAMEGVSVAYIGECDSDKDPGNPDPAPKGGRCGGSKAVSCQPGLFCNFPLTDACGVDLAPGTCEVQPALETCGEIYAPVCGCDEQTYDNICIAHAHGIAIRDQGACASTAPAKLGDACGSSDTPSRCEDHLFCAFEPAASCGEADLPGRCEHRPKGCDDHYDPVCGCDNQTHGNACLANLKGVSVLRDGTCETTTPEGEACGSRGLKPCEEGLFCNFPVSANCGATDLPGVCEPLAELCEGIYAPVCGCDAKTYPNECDAARHGVSVAKTGEC